MDTEKLLARMAAMESELATFRAQARRPDTSNYIDPAKLQQALTTDPHGTLSKLGAPVDYITKVMVANAMQKAGMQVPDELKVLASQGPQISAQNALAAQVEEVRSAVSSIVAEKKATGVRESFKALIGDKTKYPNLAKAYAADPTLFELRGDNAEEYANAEEARIAKLSTALGVPAASVNADNTQAQSTQSQPNGKGAMDNTPPPIPKPDDGVWTPEKERQVRDEIVRKHTSTEK